MLVTSWPLSNGVQDGVHKQTPEEPGNSPCQLIRVRTQGTHFTLVFSRKPDSLHPFAALWAPNGEIGRKLIELGFIDCNGNPLGDYGLAEPVHRETEDGYEVHFEYGRRA